MSNRPQFSHRHYVLIAEIIADLPDDCRARVADAFARGLGGTNNAYDKERFTNAALGKPVNGRDRPR